MSKEAEDYIEMAEDALSDARLVMEESERLFWNSTYYAVFYAAKGALLSLGYEPRTHSGTDSLVGKSLYKEKELIEAETAAFYSDLRRIREEIDYEPQTKIETDKQATIKEIQDFIQKMRKIMEEKR